MMSGDQRVGRLAKVCAVSARRVAGGAVALAVLAWASGASAYDVKKTPKGATVRWVFPSVTFHLDPSIDAAADGARDAIASAGRSWSGVGGAPAIDVIEGGGGESPGFDQKSTVFYAPGGSTLAGGALAVTLVTYDDSGHVLDADVIVNGRYPFAVLEESARPGVGVRAVSNEGTSNAASVPITPTASFDLTHVVAHEMGHALGLADEQVDPAAVMYLFTSPGDASRRAPGDDDTAGVTSLYEDERAGVSGSGSMAGSSKGCGKAAVSPRAPTTGDAHGAIVLALGFGAWIALRTRRKATRWAAPFVALSLAATAGLAVPAEHVARSMPASRGVAMGDARARVDHVETTAEGGLFVTRATLTTTECRGSRCPSASVAVAIGGTIGDVHQMLVGAPVPAEGDEVEIALDDSALDATGARIARIVW